jgi:alpha-beta hydrolase superfamily lysophospholipase
VVLLTHGHSATSAMWRPQIDALSRRNTLVTWDLRGHGRSGSPDDPAAYSVDATLGDMAAILDAVGATRAIVVNQNLTISAGGAPFTYDMFKKGVPDVFTVNAAEFVRDAFLYAARTGGKE